MKHPVTLVTADGSIDCQTNPAEQEAMTSNLHWCEVIAALEVLADGGSLVVKAFTFFEANTVSLLYLLSCAFKEVSVYKPITSKMGNSEVYVVCLGYTGRDSVSAYLDKLATLDYSKPFSSSIFSQEEMAGFLLRSVECTKFFTELQMKSIQWNVNLFHNDSTNNVAMSSYLKEIVLQAFEENNPIEPIDCDQYITGRKLSWDAFIHPVTKSNNKWIGHFVSMNPEKRLHYITEQFKEMVSIYGDKATRLAYHFSSDLKYLMGKIKLTFGQRFNAVNTTRFCYERIVTLYMTFVDLLKEQTNPLTAKQGSFSTIFIAPGESNNDYDDDDATKKLMTHMTNAYPQSYIGLLPYPTHTDPPSATCALLKTLIQKIENNSIPEGSSVCLANQPLLSRLQNGLFHILSCCFNRTTLLEGRIQGTGLSSTPVLKMEDLNLSSAKYVLHCLKLAGWREDLIAEGDRGLMEVIDAKTLIESNIHSHKLVCWYNARLLLRWCTLISERIGVAE